MARATARDRLVLASQALLRGRGYAATPVDAICASAGVSKGSFYHFFRSKEELALAALDAFFRATHERLLQGAWREIDDPCARALGFLDQTAGRAEEIWGKGCLLGTFAAELADTSPALQARVAGLFGRLEGAVAEVFEPIAEHARARGPGPSAVELAGLFLAVVEGGVVVSRGYGEPRRIELALAVLRDYFGRLAA